MVADLVFIILSVEPAVLLQLVLEHDVVISARVHLFGHHDLIRWILWSSLTYLAVQFRHTESVFVPLMAIRGFGRTLDRVSMSAVGRRVED
ncbi:hypothetical protein P171DRAFT_66244 [Karstenula rhodostoma CBS 690.94]|uniref:Uncharacterized protein n=1 Tax=Karstenula rhodostoma CBS 690.94 TaxID=1392251 RepID=A0A9P4UAS7_9PLEO|nr:hypothetical protein P171DRAFT_66244 [Karstenula rhodostoma CBS 690.94]